MTGIGIAVPDGDDFLLRRIAALEKRVQDLSTGRQASIWRDQLGNIVLSADSNAFGLAHPHLPSNGMIQWDLEMWTGNASATFTDLLVGVVEIQNPRLSWSINFYTDATTAEYQVLVNGVQVGTTQVVNFGLALYTASNVVLPVGTVAGQRVTITVRGRVAAGSGKARAACRFLQGDQA